MIIPFIIILIGLLGFLTILLVLTKYRSNRMINPYLIITILLVAIRLIFTGLYSLNFSKNLNELMSNYNQFFILIIPSVYLYIHNLVFNIKKISYQDLKHFVLPIIFSIYMRQIDGHISTISQNWKITLFLSLATYFFYYWYLFFRMLLPPRSANKYFINLKKENNRIRSWSLFLLILCTLCLVRVIYSIYLQLFANNYLITYHGYIWISAASWLIVFLKILISPRILYGYESLNNIVKEEKISRFEFEQIWNIPSKKEIKNLQDIKLKTLIDINIIEYISAIERVSSEFESFKNFQFSTSDLALKIKVPSSHVNYIFKYHSKLSFSDFKKTVRIQQSVVLIASQYLKTNTLESLAKEVGFASYNPFFSSFKTITGQSPKDYVEQLNA